MRTSLAKGLKTLPDLERILSKIYTYSVKGKVKAFYVDAQAMQRLDEFYEMTSCMKDVDKMLSILAAKDIKSARL